TAVGSSTTKTTRALRTSTANRAPERANRQARSAGDVSGSADGSATAPGVWIIGLLHELEDHAEELLGGERLGQVVGGALPLAPQPIALLILRAHEDHRGVLDAGIATDAAQHFVAVALGHHDVEEQHVRPLLHHTILEQFAVLVGDH